LTKIFI